MLLTDFLVLSKDEINSHQHLISLLGLYELEYRLELKPEILALIKETDPLLVVRLALTNFIIDNLCYDPELREHWQSVWHLSAGQKLTTSAASDASTSGYQPQVPMHCFNLIKGIVLYWQYKIERRDHPEHADDYLSRAVSMGCFKAMNAWCNQQLKRLQTELTQPSMDELLTIANQASEWHWTTGYLLFANVCLQLAGIIKSKQKSFFMSSCDDLYRKALQALYLAEYLQDYSTPSIHNAYDGMSLAEVYKGSSLSNMSLTRQHLIKSYPILQQEHQDIQKKAKMTFDQMAVEYQLESIQTHSLVLV